jgi:hypothetical protein
VHAAEVELPLLRGQASAGVGEIDAPIRAGNEIIGPIDTLPSQALSQRSIYAIGFAARDLPVIPFTDEETPLTIEGHPIRAAALLSDDLWPTSRRQSIDQVRTHINEQPIAIRMPHRSFSKDKPGGETLRLRRLYDIGELGCHHILPVMIRMRLSIV